MLRTIPETFAAIGTPAPVDRAITGISRFPPVPRRPELAALLAKGATFCVDYAHTPDPAQLGQPTCWLGVRGGEALQRVLSALQPADVLVVAGKGYEDDQIVLERDPSGQPICAAAL
jgi:UDP-N-acetylmuramyl tripeptide synthase